MAELGKLGAAFPVAGPGGGRTLRGRSNVHRVTPTTSGLGVLGLSREFSALMCRQEAKL